MTSLHCTSVTLDILKGVHMRILVSFSGNEHYEQEFFQIDFPATHAVYIKRLFPSYMCVIISALLVSSNKGLPFSC